MAVAGLVVALSGCAKPIVATTGPLAIRSVEVSATPAFQSDTDLLALVRQTLPPQLIGTHDGQSTKLDVTLVDVHYKNPLTSLLVGDSNRLSAVAVLRTEAGREVNRFEVLAIDQAALNGIAGAVLSAAQDRARVDRALARSLAARIETRIYGKTSREVMTPELASKMPKSAPAPIIKPSETGTPAKAPSVLPKAAWV